MPDHCLRRPRGTPIDRPCSDLLIAVFATLPYRFLMNVGDYLGEYSDVPGNVHLEAWFPQPAVIPHVDLFIHNGGNNGFNEALYFGKPAIIMHFCWDGLDNAARILAELAVTESFQP